MKEKGWEIEHHCCSSDNNSLDGTVIDRRVAIIDGTAPHTVDPVHPGVVDEILNLGEYWNREELMKHREEIIQLGEEIEYHFKKAYTFLKEAGFLYQSLNKCFYESWKKEMAILDFIERDLFTEKSSPSTRPESRHLFASAITSDGVISHLHTLLHNIETIYLLKVQVPHREDFIIKSLAKKALRQGYHTLILHCGLHPTMYHHLILEERETAIITEHSHLPFTASNLEKKRLIPLSLTAQKRVPERELIEIEENFSRALERAIREIREARTLHHRREEYYIEAMDFEGINRCTEETQEKIMSSLGSL